MITLQVLLVAILMGWLYALIFARWQRGLYWLVTYLPFAGAVTIAMNLWWPSLLLKDVLFVIPLYIAFFARFILAPECLAGFPRRVAYLMLCLLILTLVDRPQGLAVLSPALPCRLRIRRFIRANAPFVSSARGLVVHSGGSRVR